MQSGHFPYRRERTCLTPLSVFVYWIAKPASTIISTKTFTAHFAMASSIWMTTTGRKPPAEFLRQVARSYYAPLSEQLKKEGLAAIEKHWREIFTKEGGKFSLEYQDGALVLTVHECPAIAHLRLTNQLFTPRFCETTVVVNETICGEAGYMSSCQYEPGEGRCVQRFWKSKG